MRMFLIVRLGLMFLGLLDWSYDSSYRHSALSITGCLVAHFPMADILLFSLLAHYSPCYRWLAFEINLLLDRWENCKVSCELVYRKYLVREYPVRDVQARTNLVFNEKANFVLVTETSIFVWHVNINPILLFQHLICTCLGAKKWQIDFFDEVYSLQCFWEGRIIKRRSQVAT